MANLVDMYTIGMNALVSSTLTEALSCTGTSWSIGEYGAIAEFHHHPDAPAQMQGLSLAAPGGGVAITEAPALTLAYEMPSGRPGLWMHGLALCVKTADAAMHQRTVITALGPDEQALQEEDRGQQLFDLGLGLSTVDFCVRTADPACLRVLEAALGKSLLDEPALFAHLQAASPHRVLVSRVGRIEVRGSIPAPSQHSPEGPHTHLLPDMLRTRRRFSATLPVPEDWLPALYIHPPNPLVDALGQPRAFDHASHERFQKLLDRHGAATQLQAKREVCEAVLDGIGPPGPSPRWTRHQRLAARVALRQLAALGNRQPALAAWQQVLDRAEAGGAPRPSGMLSTRTD